VNPGAAAPAVPAPFMHSRSSRLFKTRYLFIASEYFSCKGLLLSYVENSVENVHNYPIILAF